MSHKRAENVNAGDEGPRASGTAEWAPRTLNVAQGCSHGCLYCYGRADALRRGQVADDEAWRSERILTRRVEKGYRGGRGQIMLPSTHDIAPRTVEAVATVAVKLLGAATPPGKPQTRLLLVTKGDGPCVERVCNAIGGQFQHRVLWRITIGCLDERLRAFWERHAPEIDMRLETLRWLHARGWQTSVSMEPLLEPWNAAAIVQRAMPFVTETIWIGKARELARRTAWCSQAMGEPLAEAIRGLEQWQMPDAVRQVAGDVLASLSEADRAKLRWKDSYAEDLRAGGWRIENGRRVEEEAMPCDG